jgi:hypothetical protein
MADDDFPLSRARRVLCACLPGLLLGNELHAAQTLTSSDPAVVQPGNYRVAFENNRLRVLEFRGRPGMSVCGDGMHSHPAHLTVLLTPARARVQLPDGSVAEHTLKAGDVFWSEAETHQVENIGGADVRAFLIEMKG